MNNFTRLVACAFAGVCMSGSVSAQTFHFDHDTVVNVPSGFVEVHNNVHNATSSSMIVTWKVIYHNLPTDWQTALGICDNQNCYNNVAGLPGPTKTSGSIAA